MSIELSDETLPNGLRVKSWGGIGGMRKVTIGEYEVSDDDFVAIVEYFFTNANLYDGDPRLALLERIRGASVGPGHGARMEKQSLPLLAANPHPLRIHLGPPPAWAEK
jgi:hypothetical protein